MTPAINDRQRAALSDMAMVILPGGGGLPSSDEIEIAHRPIGLALRARPDLAEPLAVLLNQMAGQDPAAALSELEHTRPGDFELLIQVILGAYCMNERVWERLGYTGQQPQTLPRDGFGAEDLAMALMATPQRFRRPPDFTDGGN